MKFLVILPLLTAAQEKFLQTLSENANLIATADNDIDLGKGKSKVKNAYQGLIKSLQYV
jgi:hypothetical protein